MLLLHWKTALATAFCVAAYSQLGLAQVPPPTILQVDTEYQVQYIEDSDNSKFATDPSVTSACFPSTDPRLECAGRHMTFHAFVVLADIVGVNGQAVKGTVVIHGRRVQLTPTPNPGQAIGDVARGTIHEAGMEILALDGRSIGSIMLSALGNGSAPPGAPLSGTMGNWAIVGGTGAFIGARGQASGLGPVRIASLTEDPANRRKNGGNVGTGYVLQVIPMTRPEVAITSSGPAIFHADFSPITAAKPAKAGEVLIVKATGLGPTVPGVDPGQPFPMDPLQTVNSPVALTLNGQAADVVNSIGWPGLVDTYRVDFRVPDGTAAGTATIQLTVAWIAGASVNIPTQ